MVKSKLVVLSMYLQAGTIGLVWWVKSFWLIPTALTIYFRMLPFYIIVSHIRHIKHRYFQQNVFFLFFRSKLKFGKHYKPNPHRSDFYPRHSPNLNPQKLGRPHSSIVASLSTSRELSVGYFLVSLIWIYYFFRLEIQNITTTLFLIMVNLFPMVTIMLKIISQIWL